MSHVRCLFALGLGTSAPWSAPPQIEILPYHHPAPAHPLTPVPSPLPSELRVRAYCIVDCH